MEQNSQQTTQTLTVSESAQENFKDFLHTLVDNFQNGIFLTEDLQLIPRDKCAEVHIPLKNQAMMEDFVETLASRVGTNILYAISLENEKRLKVIAYSMPYSNEMYVISIDSRQYGVIDEIVVAFYDSMDDMFQDLRHDYLAGQYMLEEPGAYKLEAENYITFCSHFM